MKFYKILNEDECHHGMQYKTGLNTDILPFNPKGDCEKGGIYFAREDIFSFLGYGPWVREVSLPKDEEVYENPDSPKKWKAHRVILGERKRWSDIEVFKGLVEDGADIHADNDFVLRRAAYNGHLEVVKFLVEKGADIHAGNDFSLRLAARNGHLEVVKFLVEKGADIHTGNDYALRWAACYSHLEVVKFLVEKSFGTCTSYDLALRLAAENGHLEVVKFLVEKGADIHADDDYALKWAAENGHTKVAEYLKSLKCEKNDILH